MDSSLNFVLFKEHSQSMTLIFGVTVISSGKNCVGGWVLDLNMSRATGEEAEKNKGVNVLMVVK
jgi:hypothetical protein